MQFTPLPPVPGVTPRANDLACVREFGFGVVVPEGESVEQTRQLLHDIIREGVSSLRDAGRLRTFTWGLHFVKETPAAELQAVTYTMVEPVEPDECVTVPGAKTC